MNKVQSGPQFWRDYPFVLPIFVFVVTVGAPILGRSYAIYLLCFYAILLILVINRPIPKPARFPLLYAYIAINILALAFHSMDIESVLNAGSMVMSIVAIAAFAYYCARVYKGKAVNRSLEISLWISLGISLCLSVALTAIGWQEAPAHFPWEALYTDSRLLLIQGQDVGHSPSLWVIAFLSAFTLHNLVNAKRARFRLLLVFIVLLVLLFASKSRLATVYLINFVIMGLAYFRVPLMRSVVFLFPLAFSVAFFVVATIPAASVAINIVSHNAQEIVGDWVRITPSVHSRLTVFAGRDILNRQLLQASLEQPLLGLGDGADILHYGVDADGGIAYNADRKIASSESVLRLSVKYGWPYFGVLVAFLLSVPWFLRKLGRKEQILKVGLWGICIESIASEGGMEVFYGISALFLFILCLFLFEAFLYQRYDAGAVIKPNRFGLPYAIIRLPTALQSS